MSDIIAVRPGDMDVTVQPGIKWEALNIALKPYGLFFPMDPGPGASIGGMVTVACLDGAQIVEVERLKSTICMCVLQIGTGCSGTNAVRYGTMKANVLNAKVVLADGTVVSTGQRARKSVAGLVLARSVDTSACLVQRTDVPSLLIARRFDLTSLFVGSEGTLGIVGEATLKLQPVWRSRIAALSSALSLALCFSDSGHGRSGCVFVWYPAQRHIGCA